MSKTTIVCLLTIIVIVSASCRSDLSRSSNGSPNLNQTSTPGRKSPQIKVTSSAFQSGGMIPKEHTCDGANISPQLAWDTVPENTKSFALIVDDPDAPSRTWVHWIVFNIPPNTRALTENVPVGATLAGGAKQGTNDFPKAGYGGPCPPNGSHRYYFKLYALDTELGLDSSATKDQVLKAMEGHVLAEGELMGKYQR